MAAGRAAGTWPSPFFLLHVDCVWRNGHDQCAARGALAGGPWPASQPVIPVLTGWLVGSYFAGHPALPPRERWVTYRDAMTYQVWGYGKA